MNLKEVVKELNSQEDSNAWRTGHVWERCCWRWCRNAGNRKVPCNYNHHDLSRFGQARRKQCPEGNLSLDVETSHIWVGQNEKIGEIFACLWQISLEAHQWRGTFEIPRVSLVRTFSNAWLGPSAENVGKSQKKRKTMRWAKMTVRTTSFCHYCHLSCLLWETVLASFHATSMDLGSAFLFLLVWLKPTSKCALVWFHSCALWRTRIHWVYLSNHHLADLLSVALQKRKNQYSFCVLVTYGLHR